MRRSVLSEQESGQPQPCSRFIFQTLIPSSGFTVLYARTMYVLGVVLCGANQSSSMTGIVQCDARRKYGPTRRTLAKTLVVNAQADRANLPGLWERSV